MSGPTTHDRAALLALPPANYLAGGYLDAQGKPRPELRSTFATAAATQLHDTITSPYELAATWDAFKMALPLHTGAPRDRAAGAAEEALAAVASLYNMENNPGIAVWLQGCAAAVTTEADLAALHDHLLAVVRQYTAIIAVLRRRIQK